MANKKHNSNASKPKDDLGHLIEKKYGCSLEKIQNLHLAGKKISEKKYSSVKDMTAYPKFLSYVTFPHSKPKHPEKKNGELLFWERIHQNHTLTIKSGLKKSGKYDLVTIGVPYGPIPRLMLSNMTQKYIEQYSRYLKGEITEEESRTIHLGKNMVDYMNQLGLGRRGGKKGDITRFKNQFERLFQSIITYEYKDKNRINEKQAHLIEERLIWWDLDRKKDDLLFIKISYFLAKSLRNHNTPINFEALKKLASSPLAMDYYVFFCQKLPFLTESLMLSWKSLMRQFGNQYKNVKDFKRFSKQAILKVLAVATNFQVDINQPGGLLMHPSPPHIPFKETTTSQGANTCLKQLTATIDTHHVPDNPFLWKSHPILRQIPHKEIPTFTKKTYAKIMQLAPQYCPYQLEQDWLYFWNKTGRQKLSSPEKAFTGFVKNMLKKNGLPIPELAICN